MEVSALQLEHYFVKRLVIQPRAESKAAEGLYVNFAGARLSTDVTQSFSEFDDGRKRYGIELRVHGGPGGENPDFPYDFEVTYFGFFEAERLPADKREDLVAVNGTSMLFGIAREQLLSLTLRFEQGAMLLPSIHFGKLAKQIRDAAAVSTPGDSTGKSRD